MAATGRSATTHDDARPTSCATSARPTTARWPGTPRRRPTSPTSTTPTACWCGPRTPTTFERAVAGSTRASSPSRRGATTYGCSTGSWCATCCPSAPAASPCPTSSTCSRTSGLRPGRGLARPLGARQPGRPRRQPVPGRRAARRPASRSRGRPRRPQHKKSRRASASSWSTPGGTRRRRPTRARPGSTGVDRRRRAQRPRPAARTPATARSSPASCAAWPRRPTVFVEGFAIGGVGGGGILESDLVVQLEEALAHDPQVINLSAGCRTRMDLPVDRARDLLPHPAAQARLRARGRGRQRLLVGAVLAGSLRLVRRRRLARPRRPGVGLLQLRRLRRRLRARPQPRQRVPRRDVRVPRDARTRATSGCSAPAWRGGAVRRSPPRSWPG